jgi:TRAP-type C4-dicarboxylate transport system permease small subunit
MFGKILTTADKILTFFEEWTLFLTVMASLISLFANVILRYGFNYSLAWSEELVRLVMIYMTFFGCSYSIKSGAVIKIDVLVQFMPSLKIPLKYVSNLALMVFGIMMIYYGWQMSAMQVRTFQKTIIMEIPLVYMYATMPLMGVSVIFRTLQVMHQDTLALLNRSRKSAAVS